MRLGRSAVSRSAETTAATPMASQRLERAELPAEAPAHRAIDVVDRIGDLAGARGRHRAALAQRVAQELADLVACRGTTRGCARPDPRCGAPRRSRGSAAATAGSHRVRSRASGCRRLPSSCRSPVRLAPFQPRSTRSLDDRREVEQPVARQERAARRGSAPRAARTSIPARSIVRNVALFGRPMAGPVIASTSVDRQSPPSIAAEDLHHTEEAEPVGDEVLGVSFATTTPLPRRRSANSTSGLATRRRRCRRSE